MGTCPAPGRDRTQADRTRRVREAPQSLPGLGREMRGPETAVQGWSPKPDPVKLLRNDLGAKSGVRTAKPLAARGSLAVRMRQRLPETTWIWRTRSPWNQNPMPRTSYQIRSGSAR